MSSIHSALFIMMFLALSLSGGCSKKNRWQKDSTKKIHYQMSAPVSMLDPHLRTDLVSGKLLGKIYEALYEINPFSAENEPRPDLASSLPSISKDGLVYTIKLKSGVWYHPCQCFKNQKRQMLAQDFVTSAKRLADPHLASGAYGYWVKYIKGMKEWHEDERHREKTQFDLPMDGIRALDDFTLEISILTPDPYFVHRLSTLALTPIPMEAILHFHNNLSDTTVGTGPFILARFDKARFELVKNPDYRPKYFPENVLPVYQQSKTEYKEKPLPYLDGVTVLISSESQTGWLQFLQGNVDALELAKDHAVEYLANNGELTREMKDKSIMLGHAEPKDNVYYLGINNQHPLLKNKFVRQAIATVIDLDKFMQLFFAHRAIKATAFIPPKVMPKDFLLPPHAKHFLSGNEIHAKNIMKKANLNQKELAENELVLLVRNTIEGRQIGDFFSSQLSLLGLKIKLESVPINVLIERAQKGQYGFFYLAWFVGLPSPLEFFELLYGPNHPGSYNRVGMQHAEFDRHFVAFKENPSGPQANIHLQKMIEIIREEVPLVPLVHAKTLYVYYPWLKNYIPTEMMFGIEQYYDLERP